MNKILALLAFVAAFMMVSTGHLVAQQETTKKSPPPEQVRFDEAPVPIKRISPRYPPEALEQNLQGTVYLRVWVNGEGNVERTVVMKSDQEIFNQSAEDAVSKWVFKPAIVDDHPVDVWVTIPVRFQIKDEN